MTSMIIFAVIMFAILIVTVVSASVSRPRSVPRSPIVEKSHKWHEPTGEYGSNHADMVDDQVVRHAQPELGYVVLNGIKRKLEDCKWM